MSISVNVLVNIPLVNRLLCTEMQIFRGFISQILSGSCLSSHIFLIIISKTKLIFFLSTTNRIIFMLVNIRKSLIGWLIRFIIKIRSISSGGVLASITSILLIILSLSGIVSNNISKHTLSSRNFDKF